MGKKIAQIILAIAIIGLVYVVYKQISTPIAFEKEKANRERVVIDRIKNIRLAERAFKSKYQRFTGDFDTLINFVLHDELELERKLVDEDDSVAMAQLKKAKKKNVEKFNLPVRDTVFAPARLSEEEIRNLRYVPFAGNQEFLLDAGFVQTESKIIVPVVECRAPYIMFLDTLEYRQEIINLIDDELNNYNNYPGVKFGSMEGANNEAGNWERL